MDFTTDQIITLRGISFIIYIFFVSICILIGLIFLRRSTTKKAGDQSDIFFLLLSLFFIVVGISYIIRIVFVFFIPSTPELFYSELFERTPLTQQWALFQVPLTFIGFGFLSLSVEIAVLKKKTRFFFSISIFITSLIMIFMPYDLAIAFQDIPILCSIITIGSLILLYIYLAIKNPGIIRKKSSNVGLGLILFFLAILLNAQTITQAMYSEQIFLITPTIIAPLCAVSGILLLFNGYRERK